MSDDDVAPEEQGDPDEAPDLPIQTIPEGHQDGNDKVHAKESHS